MEIVTIETTSLGDRSYLITDGIAAAVVDPQRDIQRILDVLEQRQLSLTHVLETHLHNDYVTGGLDLARQSGADYVLPEADEVAFARTGVSDGDEIVVGGITIRCLHTPGHTFNHMAYLASDDGPQAVFTGGSMLFNSVGRTDLLGGETAGPLTLAQYHSVRKLASELPAEVGVHPTHGFGSFCSASATAVVTSSTIGEQRRHNIVFSTSDAEKFVQDLLSGLSAFPRYYAHMAPINSSGPAPVDLSEPQEVDADEMLERIRRGQWVVDLRHRSEFAREHIAGSLNLQATDSFATYLGWSIPWGTPVTLLGDSSEQIREAQVQMARIGIDRPAGAAQGQPAQIAPTHIRSYPTATFADLASRSDVIVVDVRRQDEWDSGHLPGAIHIPLDQVQSRISEVPSGQVWVHCASGYRAAIAASMFDAAGREVVMVDDNWDPT